MKKKTRRSIMAVIAILSIILGVLIVDTHYILTAALFLIGGVASYFGGLWSGTRVSDEHKQ